MTVRTVDKSKSFIQFCRHWYWLMQIPGNIPWQVKLQFVNNHRKCEHNLQ